MPIDPSMVKWDEAPAIDVKAVKWDEEPSTLDAIKQGAGNLAAGAVRGAGSIGATLLTPVDAAARALGVQNSFIGRNDRRAEMDAALQAMGAQPDSFMYQGGKLGAEIAGTAGAGGAIANGARALGASPAIVGALQTGGFRAPGLAGAEALGVRMGAGGLTGAAQAGLVDPNYIPDGFLLGSLLPPAAQLAGKAGQAVSDKMRAGANRLMQSAVKPTIAQLRSGDAAVATQTMLDRGLNPTASGVEKLRALIDATDNQITGAIANSPATVSKGAVLDAAWPTRAKFANQVDPMPDINAIDAVSERFYFHPKLKGDAIPVQAAQELKQGTYKALAKKYGQLGSADTEAQKALARGLKEEIAAAVPGISGLNAEQSQLLRTLGVIERRALMEGNKNPLGLAAIAPTKAGLLAFLADRNGVLKSMAARGMNSAAPVGGGLGLLDNPALLPYVRGGLLSIEANP